jgi:hypothetical protein
MVLGMLSPLILLTIIVFILLFVLMGRGGFSFVKFYFTIVAIVSVIGMAIAFGIAIYQQGMQFFISDEEYVSSRGHREIEQCSQPERKSVPDRPEGVEVTKSTAEIARCKEEKTTKVMRERSFSTKEATIGGITRGFIFLILFLTHYPRMLSTDAVVPTPKKPRSTRKKPTTRKKKIV